MKPLLKLLALTAILLLLDGVWIQSFMAGQYQQMIPAIQGSPLTVRLFPSIIAYILIVASVYLLAYPHVRRANLIQDSMFYGGLLGLFVYGIFSYTNYAVIQNWSPFVAIMDTLWGFILYSVSVGTLVYFMGESLDTI